MSWADVQPWWNGLAPVVTLVVGYFGTILTESRRDARGRAIAHAERLASRRLEAEDRRRAFELEKLLEADAAHRDLMKILGGALGGVEFAETEFREANRALAAATGYVLEAPIRALLETMRKEAVEEWRAWVNKEPFDHRRTLAAAVSARDAIQARVRTIYEESVTTI